MRQATVISSWRASGANLTRPSEAHLVSVGFALLDHDLRFVQANDAMTRLAGSPSQILLGQRVDAVFPHARPRVMRALGRLIEGTKGAVVMNHAPAAIDVQGDGRRVWRFVFRAERNAAGRVTAVSLIATDATALHRARERARLQHRFQEILVRVSSSFVNIPADRVDGQVREGLRQLVEFLQCDRGGLTQINEAGQLVITHLYSVPSFPELPRFVMDEAFPWLAGLIRRGGLLRICDGEHEVPPEAVHERAWMARTGVRAHLTVPFSVGAGGLCAIHVTSKHPHAWPPEVVARLRLAGTIFVNAVLRKRAEEDLQRTRENLAHMVRVKTMGELASSIAHEVNQPLCAMVSNAQAAQHLLSASTPDLGEIRGALADIVADGKRAGDVIGRTRDMLKQHDVRFAPQDVNHLILRIKPDLANYAMLRHVRLEADLAGDLPPVLGHGVQIQQVVTNLLMNAIDAIPHDRSPDGRVLITTRYEAADCTVLVRVSDNGVGLPPGDVERLFEPFYTSKPSGLGMGLPISRTIAESHAGKLWAEPNPDAGATFCFRLPAHLPPARKTRRPAG